MMPDVVPDSSEDSDSSVVNSHSISLPIKPTLQRRRSSGSSTNTIRAISSNNNSSSISNTVEPSSPPLVSANQKETKNSSAASPLRHSVESDRNLDQSSFSADINKHTQPASIQISNISIISANDSKLKSNPPSRYATLLAAYPALMQRSLTIVPPPHQNPRQTHSKDIQHQNPSSSLMGRLGSVSMERSISTPHVIPHTIPPCVSACPPAPRIISASCEARVGSILRQSSYTGSNRVAGRNTANESKLNSNHYKIAPKSAISLTSDVIENKDSYEPFPSGTLGSIPQSPANRPKLGGRGISSPMLSRKALGIPINSSP